jgi:hypothetical protein
MRENQFGLLTEFAIKVKPHVPFDERKKMTQQQLKDEQRVEHIRWKLNVLHGDEDEVLQEGLRQEGLSE